MGVNINLLLGKMKEHGFTQDELSKVIGMDRSTLNKKLRAGGGDFSVTHSNAIRNALSLTAEEACAIFFNEKVADSRQ